MIEDLFGHRISEKKVEALILLASKAKNVELEAMIHNTYTYHLQVRPCRNVFGAIHHAITNGGWDISDTTVYSSFQGAKVNSLLMMSQDKLRVMYGLA